MPPTANPSRPLISVIVPVYNNPSDLSKCLASLRRAPRDDWELIVVDDCSTESIREIACQYRAKCFRTTRQGEPGLARNLGARQAEGDILLFVDADVVVPPEAIKLVRQYFDGQSTLAALFGSYDDEPACRNFWSSFKNLFHHFVHQTSGQEPPTFWAGFGAIRRSAFEAIGGFDSKKFPRPSIEDIDLGLKLVGQGQKIRLIKQLQVKHLKRWSALTLWQTDIFLRAGPWSRLILETGFMPFDLNLTWKSQLSAFLVGTLPICAGFGFSESSHSLGTLLAGLVLIDLLSLLLINRKLYLFFRRKRGNAFAIGGILAHWLYLSYSGVTFCTCLAVNIFWRLLRPGNADRILHSHPVPPLAYEPETHVQASETLVGD